MVSQKLRKVREGVQARKQATRERVEKARFRGELAKSKVRESGPVQEAKATKRELTLLGREVGGPAKRVGEKVAAAGVRAQSAIESLDEQFGDPTRAGRGDIRELAEADDFGLAGADFNVDLEVVDDFERGEEMRGMGELGFDTVFDAEPGVGILGERDPDDLEFIGEMDAIDRDLMRDLGGE